MSSMGAMMMGTMMMGTMMMGTMMMGTMVRKPSLGESTHDQSLQILQDWQFLQQLCGHTHDKRQLLRGHQRRNDKIALGVHVPLRGAVHSLGQNRALQRLLDTSNNFRLGQRACEIDPGGFWFLRNRFWNSRLRWSR
jgi:hypothetical protein